MFGFNLQISGLETNVNFLLDLSSHEEFVKGNVHTNFIRDQYDTLFRDEILSDRKLAQAALAVVLTDEADVLQRAAEENDTFNPFVVESGFRINHALQRVIKLKYKDNGTKPNLVIVDFAIVVLDVNICVKYDSGNVHQVSFDEGTTWKMLKGELSIDNIGNAMLRYNFNGVISSSKIFRNEEILSIFDDVICCQFSF